MTIALELSRNAFNFWWNNIVIVLFPFYFLTAMLRQSIPNLPRQFPNPFLMCFVVGPVLLGGVTQGLLLFLILTVLSAKELVSVTLRFNTALLGKQLSRGVLVAVHKLLLLAPLVPLLGIVDLILSPLPALVYYGIFSLLISLYSVDSSVRISRAFFATALFIPAFLILDPITKQQPLIGIAAIMLVITALFTYILCAKHARRAKVQDHRHSLETSQFLSQSKSLNMNIWDSSS